jgi:hypothetical protein
MLTKTSDIIGRRVRTTDDEIGSVTDILFDGRDWTVRYVLVDTGKWLPGEVVILPAWSAGRTLPQDGTLPVSLTSGQVRESPGVEKVKTASEQYEMALAKYLHWSPYWKGQGLASEFAPEEATEETRRSIQEGEIGPVPEEPHLRSVEEVSGYTISATDGEIGHLETLLLNPASWAVRLLMVDTRNWLPGGRKVLVSPHWARSIDWAGRSVVIDHTREEVRSSPEYDPDTVVDDSYEEALHRHYGRTAPWEVP